MGMRNYNIKGIVLKSTNYKDADKIYSVLTRELGKISVLGKGVRKISSRRGGNMDTINLISAKLSENRKGFKRLEEVKTIDSFKEIKESYELSCAAYYMAELIYRSLEEEEESEKIFNLLVKCLKVLTNPTIRPGLITNHFELGLLGALGYEYQADRTTAGEISEIIHKMQVGRFPKEIEKDIADEVDKVIKTFLNTHLDSKIKSLELSIK
jgi:DNA repair protein RecO (recombination protein O)